IDLYYGWNIMSFYNRPYPMDMLDIVNPLIALDVLVKVQDEAGGTIVFLPGGWVNTIGDMAVTEGYYIRLNDDALLNTIGSPVMLPFDIPLLNGWNIMGYPVTGPQNALDAVQPLIDAGELVKVQSETGDAIINMPWGWINTIGNFEPGEGYNIKVNTNTYLTLNEPLIALSTSDISDEHSARQDGHFTPIHIGNPYLPMNICITSATINDINLGISDEISVFDGDICVGSKILAGEIDQFISIAVSTDDPITEEIDGFITGNQITYRVWDSSEQVEYTDVEVVYLPDYLNAFKSLETAVAEIKVYSIEATQLGGNYPNPFMAGTKINFSLREAGNVTIEIYNILGQKVRTLVDGYYTVNNHSEYWNGLDDNNQKVSNGIYFYKMTAGNYSSIKKMIMMK
ncbi:MAG: T9SS type A sorting domain-containing protein, partial [Candidatus Cloacimonetes bacterium]|nr:T9SS type A sorting domain-containing protein [Candidatus Cloacimonadota bacterium]